MDRLIRHCRVGLWPDSDERGSVTLDFDARHRRRVRLCLDDGRPALLDLKRAVAMGPDNGLEIDGSGWIRVRAASELLLEISTPDSGLLLRLAWHLGNRHVPAEIVSGRLRIRPDHVLAAMLTGLGGRVRAVTLPFQPEGGAYGGDAAHDHDTHRHSHGHHDHDDG